MLEEVDVAQEGLRQRVVDFGVERVDVAHVGAEDTGERDDIGTRGGFVEADADARSVDGTQVHARGGGLGVDRLRVDAGDVQGVEEVTAER